MIVYFFGCFCPTWDGPSGNRTPKSCSVDAMLDRPSDTGPLESDMLFLYPIPKCSYYDKCAFHSLWSYYSQEIYFGSWAARTNSHHYIGKTIWNAFSSNSPNTAVILARNPFPSPAVLLFGSRYSCVCRLWLIPDGVAASVIAGKLVAVCVDTRDLYGETLDHLHMVRCSHPEVLVEEALSEAGCKSAPSRTGAERALHCTGVLLGTQWSAVSLL